VGVVDVPPENVKQKGRLHPGQMFVISFDEQRIIEDAELKAKAAAAQPYGECITNQVMDLAAIARAPAAAAATDEAVYDPAKFQALVPQMRAVRCPALPCVALPGQPAASLPARCSCRARAQYPHPACSWR
jgi:hypothetical protein